MRHGLPAATTGQMPSGVATLTRPAPPRRAELPHSTAAPDMPRLPATIRIRPKFPLLLSGARGGRRGGRAIRSSAIEASLVGVSLADIHFDIVMIVVVH